MKKLAKSRRVSTSKIIFFCVCLIPVFVLYGLFKIYPLFDMFMQSFQSFTSIFGDRTWNGIENYRLLFETPAFWTSLGMTIFYIVVPTLITITLALVFAAMLAKTKIFGKTFFRVVLYFPNILSVVIITGIFSGLLNTNGVFNAILMKVFNRTEAVQFFGDINWARFSVVLVMTWQAVGYYMVMYLAGMDSIPDSLYESARIDGAGVIVQFFQITIPLLWEVIRTTLVFFLISNINLSFLVVQTMGVTESVQNTLNYMQAVFNRSQYGTAMAVGTLMFVVTFVLSLIIQRVTKREVVESQ